MKPPSPTTAFTNLRLIKPVAAWDDLAELPSAQKKALRDLRTRAKVYRELDRRQGPNRGFGLSALFCGVEGTRKLMAAEVLAKELMLPLYRTDLNAVVSKYIGETEKNLRRLFDTVGKGNAILFFDEADALFGKRTDVKDSHDRYAKAADYLIRLVKNSNGVTILSVDKANTPRSKLVYLIDYIVRFPKRS